MGLGILDFWILGKFISFFRWWSEIWILKFGFWDFGKFGFWDFGKIWILGFWDFGILGKFISFFSGGGRKFGFWGIWILGFWENLYLFFRFYWFF
jgi:hypothetical protein